MAENHELPEDIIRNILARMPTKPLVRFKCISRNWNLMISDPNFMSSRSRRMILFPAYPFYAIDTAILRHNDTMIKLHSSQIFKNGRLCCFVGTLNGIVVLTNGKTKNENMIIYNPFTGALKIVPDHMYGHVYGFCYGTTAEDLKIVRLRVVDNTRRCEVFCLKNWSWSQRRFYMHWTPLGFHPGVATAWSTPIMNIGDFKLHFLDIRGIFVEGFLYWPVESCDNNSSNWVLSLLVLNVNEMVFSQIRFPPDCSFWYTIPLGTLRGRLCFVSFRKSDLCGRGPEYELWVRNKESWSKVRYLASLWRIRYVLKFDPICILDEGKLVMFKLPNKLIFYDLLKDSYEETHEVNELKNLPPIELIWPGRSIEYVESSISIGF
ncbi:F-box/kelch-repeat protein At3g06240-like [Rutidosis leptorrhynchoides]|uniref:F-box/kelch-repeat protein At3g06240-like n=1 Tax=Rutidosis leptorrhynchoides TaxID=125765 RepID=UPI003A9A3EA9